MSIIYDDNFLMETFGTIEPTALERAEVFARWWDEWHQNSISILHKDMNIVRKEIRALGYKDFVDFQTLGNEVRFKTTEALAMAKLIMGDKCV